MSSCHHRVPAQGVKYYGAGSLAVFHRRRSTHICPSCVWDLSCGRRVGDGAFQASPQRQEARSAGPDFSRPLGRIAIEGLARFICSGCAEWPSKSLGCFFDQGVFVAYIEAGYAFSRVSSRRDNCLYILKWCRPDLHGAGGFVWHSLRTNSMPQSLRTLPRAACAIPPG